MNTKTTVAKPKDGTIELRAECKHCGSAVWTKIRNTNPLICGQWVHEGTKKEECP